MEGPFLIERPRSHGEKQVAHPLGRDAVTIGRAPDNDIHVRDEKMSKRHARIARVGNVYTLEDLRSKNGTRVNGQPVATGILNFGDVIRMGKTRFQFASSTTPNGSPPQPAPPAEVCAGCGRACFGVVLDAK